MSMFETLWREPTFFDVGDGGGGALEAELDALLEDETDEEREAREAEEAEAARVAAAALTADDVEAEVQRRLDARVEQSRRDLEQRLARPAADPKAEYRARLQAIADELDPVKQEEMRVELAEERVSARFSTQLAHSASQGAEANILKHIADLDERVKPYLAAVIRDQGIAPDIADNAVNARAVADIAEMRARRAGKFDAAVEPAKRTPVLRPAPAGGGSQVRTGLYERLDKEQKAIVDANVRSLGEYALDEKGKQKPVEELFSKGEIAEMLAAGRN